MFEMVSIPNFFILVAFTAIVLVVGKTLYKKIPSEENVEIIQRYTKSFKKEKKIFYIIMYIILILLTAITMLYGLSFTSQYYFINDSVFQRTLVAGFGADALLSIVITSLAGLILHTRLYFYYLSKKEFQENPKLKKIILWIPIIYTLVFVTSIISLLIYMNMRVYV